jgi:two-component system chemotaxis response regulator CheB
VDPLFTSAAAVWGNKLLGPVLTGMGSDGPHGSQAIVAAGTILAQNEASSLVVGRPG